MLRRFVRLLQGGLVTGLVPLAPVGRALDLGYLLVRALEALFPDAWRPRVLGYPLPGLGVLGVFVLALLVGLIAHNFFGQRLVGFFDRNFQKVPLFGTTYGLIKQVFESVFSQGADSFKRAVLIEYPRNGVYAIAFVTSSSVPVLSNDGHELISVFL